MKKAIVFAGSRGIGKAIAEQLAAQKIEVVSTSTKTVDTSDLEQIERFCKSNQQTDILVLNTGGPPAKDFFEVSRDEWEKYHRQLFLGFCEVLQQVTINPGGYIFLITSCNIKEPDPKLVLSNAYRIAFSSVLKSLSKHYAAKQISCINIAPGPIKTDRLYSLVENMDEFEKTLPMKRAGMPEEIGRFVGAIVAQDIKYLSGVTINFDGAISKYVLA